MASGDDERFAQEAFGAGIKRKRVPFVPSKDAATLTTTSAPATVSSSPATGAFSIAEKYLSIVLSPKSETTVATDTTLESSDTEIREICEICRLPIKNIPKHRRARKEESLEDSADEPSDSIPHEASLAHQVCLPHSHPPSAIDRTGTGYRYLSSYGWDPDSRVGLGPTGSGILAPLKPKIKNDTVGLGVGSWKDETEELSGKRHQRQLKQLRQREEANRLKSRRKLNAKEVRQQEEEKKKRGETLRDSFYRSEDLDKFLGT